MANIPVQPGSVAVSLGAAGQSEGVSVSTVTDLATLPKMVSSLIALGASATVRLQGGSQTDILSVINSLNANANTNIVSAAITLRGDKTI